MPEQRLLADLRAQLEDEQKHLRAQLLDLGVSGDGALSFDENFADSGQVAAEQGETRVLAASLVDLLRDVDTALSKLDEGAYGRCEVCGEEISGPRLEAMPATRYCINHA
jgi:RNA polymerase-binding transcription factor DksA